VPRRSPAPKDGPDTRGTRRSSKRVHKPTFGEQAATKHQNMDRRLAAVARIEASIPLMAEFRRQEFEDTLAHSHEKTAPQLETDAYHAEKLVRWRESDEQPIDQEQARRDAEILMGHDPLKVH